MEEAVLEGWMPLESYVDQHDEADLTDKERTAIANWVNLLRGH